MKKSILILFVCCSFFANAQFVTQWQHRLGGLSADQGNCIIQTADSGFAVIGYTSSNDSVVYGNHGNNDYLLFKLDANGNQQWHRWYGSSQNDNPESIIQTPDGGFLISGMTTGNDGDVTGNHGSSDVWLVKTDYLGFIKWQKCYGGLGIDAQTSYYSYNNGSYPAGVSIINTLDGGYMLGTSTNLNNGQVSGNHGGFDYWLVKLNDTGSIQWQKCYGANQDEILASVIQNSDGSYAAAGYTSSNTGQVTSSHDTCYYSYYNQISCSYDYWIIKIDTIGNLIWEKSYGGSGNDIATSIAATDNDGYIVAGFTTSNDGDVSLNHGFVNYWLIRLDSSGNAIWKNCYGGSQSEEATSVIANNNGGFMVIGNSYSHDIQITNHHDSAYYGYQDIWAVELDSNGAITRQSSFGGSLTEGAGTVVKTYDGGYAIAGYTNSNDGDVSPATTEMDFWVLKINTNVGINEINPSLKINLYPNPSNGEFILTGTPPNSQFKVIDVMGNEIYRKQIINSAKSTINISELSNGIYFWELVSVPIESGGIIGKGKIVIIK